VELLSAGATHLVGTTIEISDDGGGGPQVVSLTQNRNINLFQS
jgi:hypothetical protein